MMKLSETYRTKLQKLSGIISEKKYYNSHGFPMSFSEFKHLEAFERENCSINEIETWKQKYGIEEDDSVIWVTDDKKNAQKYMLPLLLREKFMSLSKNESNSLLKEEYGKEADVEPLEFTEKDGFIIAESDDGENGYLMVLTTFINESLFLLEDRVKMSDDEVSKGWSQSTQRVMGYNEQLMIQAIKDGRVIGISYQSKNMPVTKFRFILPVFLGTYKNGTKKLRAYHMYGQSEKAAKGKSNFSDNPKTTPRKGSAQAYGEWRLFNVEPGPDKIKRFKGMWLTDKYFFESPPDFKVPHQDSTGEYTTNDSGFSSMIAFYDPKIAKANYVAKEPEGEPETVTLRPEKPTQVPLTIPTIEPKKPTTTAKIEPGKPTVPTKLTPNEPEIKNIEPEKEVPEIPDEEVVTERKIKNPKLVRNKLIRPLFKTIKKK